MSTETVPSPYAEVAESLRKRLMTRVIDLTALPVSSATCSEEHRARVQEVAEGSGRCQIAVFVDEIKGRAIISEWNMEPEEFGGAQLRRSGKGATPEQAMKEMLGQSVLGQIRTLDQSLWQRLRRRR